MIVGFHPFPMGKSVIEKKKKKKEKPQCDPLAAPSNVAHRMFKCAVI